MKPQGANSYTIEIYAYLMFVYVWPSRVCHDCSLFRVMASRNLDFRVEHKYIKVLEKEIEEKYVEVLNY